MKYPRAFIFHDPSDSLTRTRVQKLLGSKQDVYFQKQNAKDPHIEREMRLFAKYDQVKKQYLFNRPCIATDATLISDFFCMEANELNLSIYWLDEKKTYKLLRPIVLALGNLQSGEMQLVDIMNLHGFSIDIASNLIPNFNYDDYLHHNLNNSCKQVHQNLQVLRKIILTHLKTVTREGIINRYDLP